MVRTACTEPLPVQECILRFLYIKDVYKYRWRFRTIWEVLLYPVRRLRNTVEFQLSESWLSRSPIIRIGMALGGNIFLFYLFYSFIWLKISLQFSNAYKDLCFNILFVRK